MFVQDSWNLSCRRLLKLKGGGGVGGYLAPIGYSDNSGGKIQQ